MERLTSKPVEPTQRIHTGTPTPKVELKWKEYTEQKMEYNLHELK